MSKRKTMLIDTEDIDPKKIKLDLNKKKEALKRDKEFDLIEHELLKFVYVVEEIVKNAQENEDIEELDSTNGINDINKIKNKLIELVNSNVDNISNPPIKKTVQRMK